MLTVTESSNGCLPVLSAIKVALRDSSQTICSNTSHESAPSRVNVSGWGSISMPYNIGPSLGLSCVQKPWFVSLLRVMRTSCPLEVQVSELFWVRPSEIISNSRL